ncbi:hypothetical protein PBY51_013140 [Eleginops maclovinus]|uniref:Uncharacterized protein n=1 Tax=Eleginops maclovinus TaxID=56733 RepID=A0AAN7Y6B7_ELEMC|nr:hypothetical protein PBY51_013140 [Eleginops maclovinus]
MTANILCTHPRTPARAPLRALSHSTRASYREREEQESDSDGTIAGSSLPTETNASPTFSSMDVLFCFTRVSSCALRQS